jgi:signal transduction histidine kinase
MTHDDHPLLSRLLREVGASPAEAPSVETWRELLRLVGRTYHEADQDREESYAILRATLESASEGVVVVDANRTVIAVNRRFGELMRVPAEIVDSGDHAAMVAAVVAQFAEPEVERARIERIHATTDTIRDELTQIDGRSIDRYSAPVRLPDGTGVGRVTFLRDVTAERAAHDQLQSAWAAAEAASNTKSMFLANMSHELRTPLNAVIGLADLLLLETGDPTTKRQREYLEGVVQSGRHLLALVNDVLDLAKIEAGKDGLELESVAMGEAIEEAMTGLVPLAHHRGVSVSTEVPRWARPVRADRVRLRQILYNLISNAVKFTDRGGNVEIVVQDDGERIAIQVKDTGIGIAAADLSRLFQAFEQLQQPSGDRPPGTGLGLALTRRLVHMHDGTIEVDSVLGSGTTFTVRLPVAERA